MFEKATGKHVPDKGMLGSSYHLHNSELMLRSLELMSNAKSDVWPLRTRGQDHCDECMI